MSLEIYSKDYPENFTRPVKSKAVDRYFYIFITLVGAVSIVLAAWPTFIWNISTSKRLGAKVENLPVPQEQVIVQNQLALGNIQVVKDKDGFTYFTTTFNPLKDQNQVRPKEFYISVPKLKIDKAQAKVDTLNFKENLSHFPGTVLPGEVGNAFVTGHSVLPQFADPKDYNAIFTKLPSLKVGDEVYVDIEGKNLKFLVQFSKVVDPHDLSVLSPISPAGRNLTLMTCVPPGTSSKRLVVVTTLI